jgi:hypothetical protein
VHEAEVVSLYFDMQTSGVELWLMGAEAWMRCSVVRRGITHDLDVLVEVGALERLRPDA